MTPNAGIAVLCACLAAGCIRVEHPPRSGQATGSAENGRTLFTRETFGGNGRTCETCHPLATGTLSPEQVQARFAANPHDVLFADLDSDDEQGHGFNNLLLDANIRVTLKLPANIHLADDPAATSVSVWRGIPSTLDSPALEEFLMYDGREDDLATQARHAVQSHFQPTELVESSEARDIAAFERTLFSSPRQKDFAQAGPDGAWPQQPAGVTEAEKRGRAFFAPGGRCARCHGGPLLSAVVARDGGPGERFWDIGVSELNPGRQPVLTWLVTDPRDGSTVELRMSDLGRALVTGEPDDVGAFRIPSLWGVSKTAPYFHDNSAKRLEDAVLFHSRFFQSRLLPGLTDQEQADIVAYLKLL